MAKIIFGISLCQERHLVKSMEKTFTQSSFLLRPLMSAVAMASFAYLSDFLAYEFKQLFLHPGWEPPIRNSGSEVPGVFFWFPFTKTNMKDHKRSASRKLLILRLKQQFHPLDRAFEPLHHPGVFVSASQRFGYLRFSLESYLGANGFDVGKLWQIMLESKLGPGFSHFFHFYLEFANEETHLTSVPFLGGRILVLYSNFSLPGNATSQELLWHGQDGAAGLSWCWSKGSSCLSLALYSLYFTSSSTELRPITGVTLWMHILFSTWPSQCLLVAFSFATYALAANLP